MSEVCWPECSAGSVGQEKVTPVPLLEAFSRSGRQKFGDWGDVLLGDPQPDGYDGSFLDLVKASDAERAGRGQVIAAQIVGAAVRIWPERFAQEIVEVARACATLGRFDRLESTVSGWQATAEAAMLGIDPAGADLHWIPEPPAAGDRSESRRPELPGR